MKITVWYLLVICLIKVKEMVNYIFAVISPSTITIITITTATIRTNRCDLCLGDIPEYVAARTTQVFEWWCWAFLSIYQWSMVKNSVAIIMMMRDSLITMMIDQSLITMKISRSCGQLLPSTRCSTSMNRFGFKSLGGLDQQRDVNWFCVEIKFNFTNHGFVINSSSGRFPQLSSHQIPPEPLANHSGVFQ